MLGVEEYGSDDGSDDETKPVSTSKEGSPKESTPLPSSSKSSNGISPPLTKPKRGPKKITIGLPSPSKGHEGGEDDLPAMKRRRLDSGAGKSSLVSMLPAPKQKAPVPTPRVLGGGGGPGLVFNVTRPVVTDPTVVNNHDADSTEDRRPVEEDDAVEVSSTLFRPSSLGKGRANISLEDGALLPRMTPPKAPVVDFFSLESPASSSLAPSIHPHPPTNTPTPSLLSLSSAPKIEEFTPPEPTPNDSYPGYYRLPDGSWAAYDNSYYQKFYDKWQSEYNAHVRALEKGMVKGFEGIETAGAQEVDALAEMEKAKKEIQEREAKKALTQGAGGAPDAPRMNIQGAKLGGRARSRHQLSTLLTEAYQNREALEERIAEGRRNRKEAGNKYGF